MDWRRLLAYITGTVDQELLLRNEYLAAENRILRAQIKGRLCVSRGEKATLAEIAHRLGRKALAEVAVAAKPDTILGWFRTLVAGKFDVSRFGRAVGRPRVDEAVKDSVVQMAQENPTWGYDRIVGALANVGHHLSDQTVGNILGRHGISPAPQRKQTTRWRDFIRAHMDVLVGTDFFTVDVLTPEGASYLLCTVLHSSGDAAGVRCRTDALPRAAVDGAASSQRNHEGLGVVGEKPLPRMIGMASFVRRFAR
jgi:hypothetical protein